MPQYGYVLDVSSSRVTQGDWPHLESLGFVGLIQCLQTGGFSTMQGQVRAVAEANLHDAAARGKAIAGYMNSQPWRPAEIIVDDGVAVAGTMWWYLNMVANDVEISDYTLPYPHITQAQAKATHDLLMGMGMNVPEYTAKWYADRVGGMQWPWIEAKWDAKYDGKPGFTTVPWGPVGAAIVGDQYAGTTHLGGDAFDLNYFDLDFLTAGGTPPTPTPTPVPQEVDMFLIKTIDRPDSNRIYAVDAAGKRWLNDQDELDIYLRTLAQPTDVLDWQAELIPTIPEGGQPGVAPTATEIANAVAKRFYEGPDA